MPQQCPHSHFRYREHHTYSRDKPLCPLPILFVPFHAPLKSRDPPTIAVAHQACQLRL